MIGVRLRRAGLIGSLLVFGASAALAGCGGDDEPETGITISHTSQPDTLDPALAVGLESLEPLWLVYTPLLTYRRAEDEKGAELIPGLASDLPEISPGGRTYTLTLREGLEYSNGTPVKPSDFEHTIQRVLDLGSAGASFYQGIAGASEYRRGTDPEADINGIEADEQSREIRVRLTDPDPTFSNALALTFAGLVPSATPFRDMTEDPPPGVGPYEITSSEPGEGFVLERSPSFPDLDIPDIPTGNIAEITAKTLGAVRQQAQDVLDGKLDYMQAPPPAELKPTILEQAADRYEEHPTASTYYFFLDRTRPPFDDPLVREAVNRGVDREGLARLAGAIEPGCALLAPGVPGYDQQLDTTACPYGDPSQLPDLAAARALIEQAGASGAKVTVRSSNGSDTRAVTKAYARTLNEIGLAATVKPTAPGGDPAAAQTGLKVRLADLLHPLDFFGAIGVDDPLIDAELDRLRGVSDLGSVSDDWRDLDSYLIAPPQSYIAPFGHGKVATFFSERMDPESALFHPLYGNDYSSWRLKEGE